jgi:hypothetical protein
MTVDAGAPGIASAGAAAIECAARPTSEARSGSRCIAHAPVSVGVASSAYSRLRVASGVSARRVEIKSCA